MNANVLSDIPVFSLKFVNWNVERPPCWSPAMSSRICSDLAVDDELQPVVVRLPGLRLQPERVGVFAAARHEAHGEITGQIALARQEQDGTRGLVVGRAAG